MALEVALSIIALCLYVDKLRNMTARSKSRAAFISTSNISRSVADFRFSGYICCTMALSCSSPETNRGDGRPKKASEIQKTCCFWMAVTVENTGFR
jgi:hypothetical protein